MANEQNPIIEILSFVGFLIVFVFGIGIKLMDEMIGKLLGGGK